MRRGASGSASRSGLKSTWLSHDWASLRVEQGRKLARVIPFSIKVNMALAEDQTNVEFMLRESCFLGELSSL